MHTVQHRTLGLTKMKHQNFHKGQKSIFLLYTYKDYDTVLSVTMTDYFIQMLLYAYAK